MLQANRQNQRSPTLFENDWSKGILLLLNKPIPYFLSHHGVFGVTHLFEEYCVLNYLRQRRLAILFRLVYHTRGYWKHGPIQNNRNTNMHVSLSHHRWIPFKKHFFPFPWFTSRQIIFRFKGIFSRPNFCVYDHFFSNAQNFFPIFKPSMYFVPSLFLIFVSIKFSNVIVLIWVLPTILSRD